MCIASFADRQSKWVIIPIIMWVPGDNALHYPQNTVNYNAIPFFNPPVTRNSIITIFTINSIATWPT